MVEFQSIYGNFILQYAICGHQRPLVRWQTATVRCVSGQPELAFSRRFCGGERPVCGPAATYSK